MESVPPRVVFFDGVCGICNWTVDFLIERDTQGNLHFAPLQGEAAAAMRERHPDAPTDIDTVIFMETKDGEERVYYRSRAIFHILQYIDSAWRHLAFLRFFPRFVTDLGYRLIAWQRYRVFGKLEACRIPTPEQRARFLT